MARYDIDSIDNRDEETVAQAVEALEGPLFRYFRPVIRGIDRIPGGPALYVGNHNAGFLSPDTFTFAIAAYRAHGIEAVPHGLGHEVAIRLPLFHRPLARLGAVRASHDNARRLFARGQKVLVYPGSDLDTFRSFRDRDRVIFGTRRGYLRLALREGVPIVPVVTAGAQSTWLVLSDGQWIARGLGLDRILRTKAWPVVISIPWGLTIGPPPPHFPFPSRLYQEVLDPIRFDRRGPDAAGDSDYVERCHALVHGRMQATLTRLAAERAHAAS